MTVTWQSSLSAPAGWVNPRLGVRFDAAGRFLAEHGNTVVAQVIPGSATEAALIWLRGALQALPWAGQFAFTAVESYHMTVFEGVIESRRQAGHWPPDVPAEASIDTATKAMAAKLDRLPALPDFTMRPVEVTPFGLRLTGLTAADETAARHWRNSLAAAFGYRTPDHDSYGFHTTLAYLLRSLAAKEVAACQTVMADLTQAFLKRVPVMDLARPAFCRFADMNRFPPVRPL